MKNNISAPLLLALLLSACQTPLPSADLEADVTVDSAASTPMDSGFVDAAEDLADAASVETDAAEDLADAAPVENDVASEPAPYCTLEVAGPVIDPLSESTGPFQRCNIIGQGRVGLQAWTTNGDLIVATAAGRVARFQADGTPVWAVTPQVTQAKALAISDDGRYVAVSDGNSLHLLSAQSGGWIKTWTYNNPIWSAAFAPGGCEVLTGHLNERGEPGLILRDLASGEVTEIVANEQTIQVGYSPDGAHFAAVVKRNGFVYDQPTTVHVQVYDATGAQVARIAGETFVWTSFETLVVGRENGELTLFALEAGVVVIEPFFDAAPARGASPRTVKVLEALPDGQLLVQSGEGMFQIISAHTLQLIDTLDFGAQQAAIKADGTFSYVYRGEVYRGEDQTAFLHLPTGSLGLTDAGIAMYSRRDDRVVTVDINAPWSVVESRWGRQTAVSLNGEIAATVVDGTVLAFAPDDEDLLPELEGASDIQRLGILAISPDGSRIAVAAGPSSVHVWRADGTLEYVLPEEPINLNAAIAASITDLSFSPDGRYLAAVGGGFHESRLWSMADGAETVLPPKGASLTWQADSSALYIASFHSGVLIAISLPELELSDTRIVGVGVQRRAEWTPFGVVLAGPYDTKVFDPNTSPIRSVQRLPGAVSVASTSDGRRLVTVTSTGTVDVYCAD